MFHIRAFTTAASLVATCFVSIPLFGYSDFLTVPFWLGVAVVSLSTLLFEGREWLGTLLAERRGQSGARLAGSEASAPEAISPDIVDVAVSEERVSAKGAVSGVPSTGSCESCLTETASLITVHKQGCAASSSACLRRTDNFSCEDLPALSR